MQTPGQRVMHDIVVLENVRDHILGIDFINFHLLVYSAANQECFQETSPMDSGTLKAIECTHIEVLSSKVVNFKCINNKQKYINISQAGHGVQNCKERLMDCYWWLNMNEDIKKHQKECLKCQATKHPKLEKKSELQQMLLCSIRIRGFTWSCFALAKYQTNM
jgi:hypothetical protein